MTSFLVLLLGLASAGPVSFDVKVKDAMWEEPGVIVQVTAAGVAERASVAVGRKTYTLVADADGHSFTGFVPMAVGMHPLRVVVTALGEAAELDLDAEVGLR